MSGAAIDRAALPVRGRGRALLGPLAPYVLHFRPAEWPIVTAHLAVSWLVANGLGVPGRGVIVGVLAWVILLNGGTLALNSAFDRDEGDIAYLRNPPPVPRHLAALAVVAMIAGAFVVRSLPTGYVVAYVACVAMSLAYSVPPVRLKAVAGADWLVNIAGFGALTTYAGMALTGFSLRASHAWIVVAFAALFAALYPLTQLYQLDEDRARGDRTLASRLGVRRSLAVAIVATVAAFVAFGVAAVQSGWQRDDAVRRVLALVIAALAWSVVLAPWSRGASSWSSADHERGMYHALAAWAITDLAVVVAWCL